MEQRYEPVSGQPLATRLERGGLWALGVFTLLSVIGFATFGLNPALLAHLPAPAAAFYGVSFRFFAIGQVWLAMAVFVIVLVNRTGLRWLPAFLALYLISLGAELLGTTRGIPFGAYGYSPLLDPMWAGHVPIVIPLSWFYMAIPSYALAVLVLPGRRQVARIALSSLVLLTWDLALDPAMSFATPYWSWESTGPYYGMPWMNLFGWYVTGVAMMAALTALSAERWISKLPLGWLAGFYLLNLLLPLGMNLAAGLWLAIAATLLTLTLTLAVSYRIAARGGEHSASASQEALIGLFGRWGWGR